MDKPKGYKFEGGAGGCGGVQMETFVLEQQFFKKSV